VKNSKTLEGAVVGSVIETNIEGIDRELKLLKLRKFLFYNKSGDMFTHPLEVMKTTRLNLMQSLSRIMN
jgi:hypothetical protein